MITRSARLMLVGAVLVVQTLVPGEQFSEAVPADAIAKLRAKTAAFPRDTAAHLRLGELLGRAGDFSAAEKEFRAAIRLQPESAEAHYNLGLTLIGNPLSKLDWLGAMAEFRLAIQNRPDYPEARRMHGEGLFNTGDPTGAIRELEIVIEQKPDYMEARFSLALALDAASRTPDAIAELRHIAAIRPLWAEPRSTLAKLLLRSGDADGARTEAVACLRINPDLPEAHLTLARTVQSVDPNRAGIELAQGQRLARRRSDALRAARLVNQALEAAAAGDPARAVTLARLAVETKPDYGLAHYNLGLLLADSGDLRGAAAELRTSASLSPALSKPWYNLGRVLEQAGERSVALGAFERAASLDPEGEAQRAKVRALRANGIAPSPVAVIADTPRGHNEAGVEDSREGNLLAATGEFLRALEQQPGFEEARYNLAIALYQRNVRDAAELELRKTLLTRSDAATHFALGLILKDKDDPEASAEFEAALALNPSDKAARHELDLLRRAGPH